MRDALIDVTKLPRNPAWERVKDEIKAMGRVEGRVEEAQEMLLLLLRERGFAVGDACEATVRGTGDRARVHRWAARVLRASSLAEVLVDE